MLTNDLLRTRSISGRIIPKFIKTDDRTLLELTDELLTIYNPENKVSRGEAEETVLPLMKAHKDVKLAKGLNKIILDRCEFSHSSDIDYQNLRCQVFSRSAILLKNNEFTDVREFQRQVVNDCKIDDENLPDKVYADLPENEKLIKMKGLSSPRQVLERYNISLVQSLLLHCTEMDVYVEDPEPVKMRNLFKYLKFFRLLAKITPVDKTKTNSDIPNQIKLHIDGPAALFENTKKYGLQLASFFPAICLLDKWQINTKVKIKKSTSDLKLDESSNLVSHYRNFSNYIPEEIRMFQKLFSKKSKHWEIYDCTTFVHLGLQELIFPDFSFKRRDNEFICHLELFHRWHLNQLVKRLEQCEANPELPLIIGVDRFLYNKPEMKKMIDTSTWFSKNGFLFRDFPGVDKVTKCLKKKTGEKGTSDPATQLKLEF